jgi:transposase-like protein
MAATHRSQKRYPPELRERAVRMVLETIEQTGERFGAITRIAELEREVRELRGANETSHAASAFFAAELDGRRPPR